MALRIVVGADLGRTVARRDHRLALRGDFVEVLRVFAVEDARTQLLERLVEVLQLGFLVLTPVSYTHLDVYKRQGSRCRRWRGCRGRNRRASARK